MDKKYTNQEKDPKESSELRKAKKVLKGNRAMASKGSYRLSEGGVVKV